MPRTTRSPLSALPDIWLVTDARNDAVLERVLTRLPRGGGLIFRHYHLRPKDRRARFRELLQRANAHGIVVALSGTPQEARRWGAAAVYGPPRRLARGPALPRLVTAHSLREIGRANGMRADAVLLSPVYPTRSHPGAPALGPLRFRLLASKALAPVIALGGMDMRRARATRIRKWAAIQAFA
jgi:thiamine-phosphate pyrophosphorylase